MMEEWIVVGNVYRKHGIRGEVKVYPLTDSPQRFLDLHEVMIQDREGKRVPARIDRVRFQKDRLILHFEGIDTLEDAEPLIKTQIVIRRSEAVALPEGKYYYADIIGLSVYTDQEKYLGTIEDIIETGSNDVYVVRLEKREVLIPAIPEVVREVDLENQKMIIHEVGGLLD